MTTTAHDDGPVQASISDTLGVVLGVMGPILARGVIIRRPKVLALAERLDLDRRAVRRMQRLRRRYGPGPLLLRLPLRQQAVILAPEHVHRVLDGAPEPFSPASSEKRAALSHFQPAGVLISEGAERADRRRFNEEVLGADDPVHALAERFVPVVRDEGQQLMATVAATGTLAWDDFVPPWFRMVRRIAFGDGARDDDEITDMMAELRAAANWAFLRPKRTELRDRLYQRLAEHLERAEPGSLAAVMARVPTTELTAPLQQVPQWLFAFDAAAMATFRTLALLASHPDAAERARAEITAAAASGSPTLPFLRACVLESLRLWPTTPAVLRQTTAASTWGAGELPEGCGIVVYAPFFHRDDQRLDYADRFEPDVWMQDRSAGDWPLIPFSGGPAMCPGRNLVLLTATHMLATLCDGRQFALHGRQRLDPGEALPGTLSPYGLRFGWAPAPPPGAVADVT